MFAGLVTASLRFGAQIVVPVLLDTAIRWLENERSRRG